MKHNTYWFNRPQAAKSTLGIEISSSFLFNQENLKNTLKSMTLSSIELAKITNKIVDAHPYVYAVANSDSSYTDGQTIVIGMGPSSENENIFNGMDIEYGIACHEACHCAYTNFNLCQRYLNVSDLCHWIHNVYEDECIEEMMGFDIPNYIPFLNAVHDHYFSKNKFKTPDLRVNEDFEIISTMLLSYVRSEDWVNLIPKEWEDTYGELFDNIYDVVDKYGLIRCDEINYSPTEQTINAAIETEKLIVDFLEKRHGKKKSGAYSDLNNAQKQKGMIGQSTSESTTPRKLKEKINQAISSAKHDIQSEKEHKALDKEGKTLEDVELDNAKNRKTKWEQKDTLQKGPNLNLSFEDKRAFQMKSKYMSIVSKHRKEIALAKKIIFHNDNKVELQLEEFHRNGNLNSRQLAQAIQGVNTVYKQMTQKVVDKTNPKYNLVLLLDESGSMNMISDTVTNISVILYEAMKDFVGIDLYVYGHGDHINCYIDTKTKKPYSLTNREKQTSQDDATAIKAVIDKVRMQSNKPIFLINITDSCYLSLDTRMQEAFKYAKEHKATLGNITIDGGYYSDGLVKATKTNNEVYGVGNWIGVGQKDLMITTIKNFTKIVEKRYKLLK